MNISGLWVPLVTPMYHGHFDKGSARRLMAALEPFADGYVAALSTGEGEVLSENVWLEVISVFSSLTTKPVAAGIFLDDVEEIIARSHMAKALGCAAIVIPTMSDVADEVFDFFAEINAKTALPVVMYSEKHPIRGVQTLERLDKLKNIVGIKESSADDAFINNILSTKDQLRISMMQGMDHKLLVSSGFDGFIVALANVEPQLCRRMFDQPNEQLHAEILKKFWEYNLGGEWFVSLKALLYARGVLSSAEQVRQTVHI